MIPNLLWAQTNLEVYVNILACGLDPLKIDFNEAGFNFMGESKSESFSFSLTLSHPIDEKASSYVVKDRDIQLVLKKRTPGSWQCLAGGEDKQKFKSRISVNWELWQDDDDSEGKISGGDLEAGNAGNGFDFSKMMQSGASAAVPEDGNDDDPDNCDDTEGDLPEGDEEEGNLPGGGGTTATTSSGSKDGESEIKVEGGDQVHGGGEPISTSDNHDEKIPDSGDNNDSVMTATPDSE